MPDENRVFDVTKPKHVSPSATSKPVIVGHHPIMSDPMVKEVDAEASAPTRIQVSDNDSPAGGNSFLVGPPAESAEPAPAEPAIMPAPESHENEVEPPEDSAAFKISPPGEADEEADNKPAPAELQTVPSEPAPAPPADDTPPDGPIQPLPQIEGLHLPEPKHSGKGLKLAVLLLLLILIGSYLAIDSGLVGAGLNLPFHVFKQKSKTRPSTPAPAVQAPAKSNVPDGFKVYKLAGTALTFAAPVAWGDPTSATDPGYSKRGANNQSDGTFAYLVSFVTNKDIQIAVTSNKYLPAARTPLYYDYLQWCTGTSDGKIYEAVLHSSTANKVDTPTTVACDQGPVPGAVKLDLSTVVIAKAQDASGKVVGDIYTKNLDDSSLVVFRVKDAGMTNSIAIKQLLGTTKTGAAASGTNQ